MSNPLSDVINITVVVQNPGVTAAGFGVPLVTSFTASWAERTRTYTGTDGASSDFAPNTPEYLALSKIFGQSPSPPLAMVGRCNNKPTQRYDLSIVTVAPGSDYSLRVASPSGSAWASQTIDYVSVGAVAWVLSTVYAAGALVTNDTGKLYTCITAGTSAGSGGPTGTAADITDGSVHWMYAGAGAAGATSNDAIVNGLYVQILALASPVFAGGSATQMTLSLQGSAGSRIIRMQANAAAAFFGCAIAIGSTPFMSMLQVASDPGIVADLIAIANASNAWYGLITTFNSSAIVAAAAGWVEDSNKLYPMATGDTLVTNQALGTGSDIAQTLKSEAFTRTAVMFHPATDEFADAGEIGRWFPINPGGDNWRMKTLAGVTAYTYTGTQKANLKDKFCNYYYVFGGVNVVGGEGKVASGQYIDVIRFLDWYVARLSERVANREIDLEKIPYDDDGIAIVVGEVRAQNKDGIKAGGINPGPPAPSVTYPRSVDVPTADKAARTLNNVNTSWELAGAINHTNVNVAVSF